MSLTSKMDDGLSTEISLCSEKVRLKSVKASHDVKNQIVKVYILIKWVIKSGGIQTWSNFLIRRPVFYIIFTGHINNALNKCEWETAYQSKSHFAPNKLDQKLYCTVLIYDVHTKSDHQGLLISGASNLQPNFS